MVSKKRDKRDLAFYTELITLTIVALIAAGMWIQVFKNTLKRFFGNNLIAGYLVAILITLVAIFGLHLMFGDKKEDPLPKFGVLHGGIPYYGDTIDGFDDGQVTHLDQKSYVTYT